MGIYSADHIYFLGDLFHGDHNKEWSQVVDTIKAFPNTHFHLILGNHDILHSTFYKASGLKVYEEYLDVTPFRLTHKPPQQLNNCKNFIFCGHIHPGVSIRGKGRQHVRLPCFFIKNNYMILQAFGTFTGLKTLKISGSDQAYVVVGDKVILVKRQS